MIWPYMSFSFSQRWRITGDARDAKTPIVFLFNFECTSFLEITKYFIPKIVTTILQFINPCLPTTPPDMG